MEYPVELDKVKHLKYKVSQLDPDDDFEVGYDSVIQNIITEYAKAVSNAVDEEMFRAFADRGYDKDTTMKLLYEKRIYMTKDPVSLNEYLMHVDDIVVFRLAPIYEYDEYGLLHGINYLII